MINSLCGSMAPMGDSSSRQPISPTASVSESNVTGDLIQENISTVHSNFSGQGMAQTSDPADHHDVEAHFLDSSIWDTIFNEEILDSHTDMMISSPIRVINAPVHPPSFNSLISEDETQHILDSSSPLQFLSSRYCNDSPANFCNFNQKPNIKLELTDLPASPSTNMNPPQFDRPNYSLQKPVMSSNSSLFGDYEAKDGMSGHESSCIIHRVPSAPQLSHKADQPPRSRKAKVEPLPISAPRPVGHGRSQSNDCFGFLPRSPSPTLPNLPHSVPSMLDYLSSPTQRTNSLIHNSGPPPMQLLNLQHNMHAVHQQKPDIGSPEELDAQDSGLQLVHLLLACAEAVAREDYLVAHRTLVQLKQVVCPLGDSMQRVASCFTEALHARLMGTGGRSYAALRAYDLISSEEVMNAYQILYQACPYIKFAHFTANQAIFEAFEGEERVHIIDLDIVQGYQWPAFVQALAARPGGAPHLRITGVGMPLEAVQETGKRLADLAESLHVPFEFHAVGERLENLQAHMFQRRIGEALAVNSVNRIHRLLSEQTSLSAILSMIREQGPNIVTLVEQEASHNGPFFLGRFLEALHYYSAIFDSLDATLPQNNPERTKVEQLIFASEICNIVACEGSERVERHEKLEKWRKIMESKGFQNVALSANAVNQSKLLLGLYPCDGYRLSEDKGSLLLGWQDRSIIAASAWHC